MMDIFDAHIHNKNHETGGFIIGLEGYPEFDGVFNNKEALSNHSEKDNYISFYYVKNEECNCNELLPWRYLKYHPRREKYSMEDVKNSILFNSPRAVIIDTLNEPYWTPYDYWNIANSFNQISFILAHAGGYLVNDFIKICHFQPNVWLDFALTHTTLGKYGGENGLPYVNEAIKYSLNGPFKDRILLSSDYPFFDQDKVFEYYNEYLVQLNNNFKSLLQIIK